MSEIKVKTLTNASDITLEYDLSKWLKDRYKSGDKLVICGISQVRLENNKILTTILYKLS